jgi:serine/threonine protein kinase
MGSLRRRGWQIQSPSSARGFTPLGEVESDGSGLLIAARSQLTQALVDIRLLTPALKGDRARMRQLSGDKDTLREVRHTNLVSVMEVDDRAGAIVYESVRGGTLAQMLIGQGPLELSAGLVLLEDCIAGLEALHNAGLLHRNVTPDSVVIETTGAVLLRDAELSPSVSSGGRVTDQSQFIAPEVLAGGAYTSASDLYAATAVFLEAIGGRASKPGMRTDLRPLLGEGMSKDPSARSATLADFRGELDDYARAVVGETWRKEGRVLLIAASADQASRALRVPSLSEPPSRGVDEALAAVALLRSPGPRDPRIWAGLGTLGFAAVIALILLVRGVSASGGPSVALVYPPNGVPNIFGPLPSAPPNAASSPGVASTSTSSNLFVPGTLPTGPTAGPTANPIGSPTGNPGPNPTPNPGGPPLLAQTIAFTSSVPSGLTYSGSYTVTANGGRSGMPVVFSSLSPSVCARVTTNGFRMTGVGLCTIVANQAGNAQYSRAPQQIMPSFSVGQASQHIAYTTSPVSPTYKGPAYTVRASAPGGVVTFSADSAGLACTVSSAGLVTFVAAGDCIIDANQAGNVDYTPAAMIQQLIKVAQASQTITMTSTSPCNPCATVTTYTVSGTASSGLAVTFDVSRSTPGSCTVSGNIVTINGGTGFPGTCVIDWYQTGDQNYAAAPIQSQTITVS